jgi:hypothetical protein
MAATTSKIYTVATFFVNGISELCYLTITYEDGMLLAVFIAIKIRTMPTTIDQHSGPLSGPSCK